jgi:hypothetical protein
MRNIVEFFDIKKRSHIAALDYWQKNRMKWPEGFLPADVEERALWFTIILSKMAEAYMRKTLRRKK